MSSAQQRSDLEAAQTVTPGYALPRLLRRTLSPIRASGEPIVRPDIIADGTAGTPGTAGQDADTVTHTQGDRPHRTATVHWEGPDGLKLLNGFPRTARFLAADPDKSTVIFRRFDEASIRNLLYLEGRVATLDALQRKFDKEDFEHFAGNEAISKAASSWEFFALLGVGYGHNDFPIDVMDSWIKERYGEMEKIWKKHESRYRKAPRASWLSEIRKIRKGLLRRERARAWKDAIPEPDSGHAAKSVDTKADHPSATQSATTTEEPHHETEPVTPDTAKPASPQVGDLARPADHNNPKQSGLQETKSAALKPATWPKAKMSDRSESSTSNNSDEGAEGRDHDSPDWVDDESDWDADESNPDHEEANWDHDESNWYRFQRQLGYSQKDVWLVKQRWNVAQALQHSLKDYEEAMLRYNQLLKLERPAKRSEQVVTSWVQRTQPPGRGGALANLSQFLKHSAMDKVYTTDEKLVNDRVSLGPTGSADRLSHWLAKSRSLMEMGRDPRFNYPGIHFTPEKYLQKWVTVCIMWFAALWVIGAIWFLWLVETKQPFEWAQLILLSFFIATFGLGLTFGTTATRDQIFGATAAYAAVLVVFIGTGNSGNGSNNGGSTNTTRS